MGVTTKLSSKFQISVPKDVRDSLGWRAGQAFVFVPKGKSVLLVPSTDFESLRGLARGANREGYRNRKDRY